MRSNRILWLLLSFMGIVIAAVWLLNRSDEVQPDEATATIEDASITKDDSDLKNRLSEDFLPTQEAIPDVPEIAVGNEFEQTLQLLASIPEVLGGLETSDSIQQYLQGILELWGGSVNKAEIARALQSWLGEGINFDTNILFRPGPEGGLRSWSSGRIFAMDALARLDPALAQEFGWSLLEQDASPEEWIMAMKTTAQFGGDEALADSRWMDRLQQLYNQGVRGDQVDHAYLYGLDLLVYMDSGDSFERLADMSRRADIRGLAHGTRLAMARMVQNASAEYLQLIIDSPQTLDHDPEFRAFLFSNADMLENQTRQQIESYLDSTTSADEFVRFTQNFPNFNRSFSYNLLTESTAASMRKAAYADREALQMVEGWLRSNRYPSQRENLEALRDRLARFVESASKGGHY